MDHNTEYQILEKLDAIEKHLEQINARPLLRSPCWNISWGVIFGLVGMSLITFLFAALLH